MQRMKKFTLTLVVAVAVAALVAPASLARPLDLGTPTPAPTTSEALEQKGPISRSYDNAGGRPPERPASADGDSPWAIVGVALVGGCLLLGGVVTVSRSRRRERLAA